MTAQNIRDDGRMSRYFAMMLHIDDDDLDPYEYKLLGHYRKMCGLSPDGTCRESIETSASGAKMSVAKAREARKALAALKCINVIPRSHETCEVTIIDRMGENVQRYTTYPAPIENAGGYQKREGGLSNPIGGGLSNPIANKEGIKESGRSKERVSKDTLPQPAAGGAHAPKNAAPLPDEKPIPPPVPATPPKSKPDGQYWDDGDNMHQRGVKAYYAGLPERLRPDKSLYSYGGRLGRAVSQILKAKYSPNDIRDAVSQAYKGSFWSETADSILPPELLKTNIKLWLKKAADRNGGTHGTANGTTSTTSGHNPEVQGNSGTKRMDAEPDETVEFH